MSEFAPSVPAGRMSPLAVLELLKPITWFPPMWAFACGVVSSGQSLENRWPTLIAGVVLAGPMVCATSQAVNDWFDRHVDAINEPNRPIPSGRIPGRWGLYIALIWTALSIEVAATLGAWGFGAAAFGLVLAWAYSAPPIRLKQNGWWGNAAVGLCYHGRCHHERWRPGLANHADRPALQCRCPRHHDAERLQVDRRRSQEQRSFLACPTRTGTRGEACLDHHGRGAGCRDYPAAGLAAADPRSGNHHRAIRSIPADAATAEAAARARALVQRDRRDTLRTRNARQRLRWSRPRQCSRGLASSGLAWFRPRWEPSSC